MVMAGGCSVEEEAAGYIFYYYRLYPLALIAALGLC